MQTAPSRGPLAEKKLGDQKHASLIKSRARPQAKCKSCGGTFAAARGGQLFCSARCRVAAHRHREGGTARPTTPKRGRVDGEGGCNAKFVFVRTEARLSAVEIEALGGFIVKVRRGDQVRPIRRHEIPARRAP